MSKQEYKPVKPQEYVPLQPTYNDPDVVRVRELIKLKEEEQKAKEEKERLLQEKLDVPPEPIIDTDLSSMVADGVPTIGDNSPMSGNTDLSLGGTRALESRPIIDDLEKRIVNKSNTTEKGIENAKNIAKNASANKEDLYLALAKGKIAQEGGEDVDLQTIFDLYSVPEEDRDRLLESTQTGWEKNRPEHLFNLKVDKAYNTFEKDSIINESVNTPLKSLYKDGGVWKETATLDYKEYEILYDRITTLIENGDEFKNVSDLEKASLTERIIDKIKSKKFHNTVLEKSPKLKEKVASVELFGKEVESFFKNEQVLAKAAVQNFAENLQKDLQNKAQNASPEEIESLQRYYKKTLADYQEHYNNEIVNKAVKEINKFKAKYGITDKTFEEISKEYESIGKALDQQKYKDAENMYEAYTSNPLKAAAYGSINFGLGVAVGAKQILEVPNLFGTDYSIWDKEINAARMILQPDRDPNQSISDMVTDPAWWLSKGVESLPLSLALMATGVGATGAAARIIPGLRALASTNTFAQMAVGQMVARPLESLIEGASAYTDARMQGISEEDARLAGWQVAAANLPLVILDAVSAVPFLNRMPTTLSNLIAKTGTSMVLESFTEGTEENVQGIIQDYFIHRAKGEDYRIIDHYYNEIEGKINAQAVEEFALGAGTGLLFGGASVANDVLTSGRGGEFAYLFQSQKDEDSMMRWINGMIASGQLSRDPNAIENARSAVSSLKAYSDNKKSGKILPNDKSAAFDVDDYLYYRAMQYLDALSNQTAFIEVASNLDKNLAEASMKDGEENKVKFAKSVQSLWYQGLDNYRMLTLGNLNEDKDESIFKLWLKSLAGKNSTHYRNKLEDKIAKRYKLSGENKQAFDEEAEAQKQSLIENLIGSFYAKSEQLAAVVALSQAGLIDQAREYIKQQQETPLDHSDIPEKVKGEKDLLLQSLEYINNNTNALVSQQQQDLMLRYKELVDRYDENRLRNNSLKQLNEVIDSIDEILESAHENYKGDKMYRDLALSKIQKIINHNLHKEALIKSIELYQQSYNNKVKDKEEIDERIVELEKELERINILVQESKMPLSEEYREYIKEIENTLSVFKQNAKAYDYAIATDKKSIQEYEMYKLSIDAAQSKIDAISKDLTEDPKRSRSVLKALRDKNKRIRKFFEDNKDIFSKKIFKKNKAKEDVTPVVEESPPEAPPAEDIKSPELPTMEEVVKAPAEEQSPAEEVTKPEETRDILEVGDTVKYIGKGKSNGHIGVIEFFKNGKVKISGLSPLVNIDNLEKTTEEETAIKKVINETVTAVGVEDDVTIDDRNTYDDADFQEALETEGEDILDDDIKKNPIPVTSIAYLDLKYSESGGHPITIDTNTNPLAFNALNAEVGDEVTIVVLNKNTFLDYQDENGNTITYDAHMAKGKSMGYDENDYIPIGIYNKSGKLLGYVHEVSWITPKRVPADKIDINEAKRQLSDLRNLLVKNKSTKSVIVSKSLGTLRTTIDWKPSNTAENIPDNNIVMLLGTDKATLSENGSKKNFLLRNDVIPNKAIKVIHPGLKYIALPINNQWFVSPIYDIRMGNYNYNGVTFKNIADSIIEAIRVYSSQDTKSPLRTQILNQYKLDITKSENLEEYIQIFIPTKTLTEKSSLLYKDANNKLMLKPNGKNNIRVYIGILPTEKGMLVNFTSSSGMFISIDSRELSKESTRILFESALKESRMNINLSRMNKDGAFNLVVLGNNGTPMSVKYDNYNQYAKSTTETPIIGTKIGENKYSYFAQPILGFKSPITDKPVEETTEESIVVVTPEPVKETSETTGQQATPVTPQKQEEQSGIYDYSTSKTSTHNIKVLDEDIYVTMELMELVYQGYKSDLKHAQPLSQIINRGGFAKGEIDYYKSIQKQKPAEDIVFTNTKADIKRRRLEKLDKINQKIEKLKQKEDRRVKTETYRTLDINDNPVEVEITTNADGSRVLKARQINEDGSVEPMAYVTERINNKAQATLSNEQLIEGYIGNKGNTLKRTNLDENPDQTYIDKINAKYDAELARELYKEMKAGKMVTDMTPAEQQVADKYITEELRKSVDAELAALEGKDIKDLQPSVEEKQIDPVSELSIDELNKLIKAKESALDNISDQIGETDDGGLLQELYAKQEVITADLSKYKMELSKKSKENEGIERDITENESTDTSAEEELFSPAVPKESEVNSYLQNNFLSSNSVKRISDYTALKALKYCKGK